MNEFRHSDLALAVFGDRKLIDLLALENFGYRPIGDEHEDMKLPDHALEHLKMPKIQELVTELCLSGDVYLVQRLPCAEMYEITLHDSMIPGSNSFLLRKFKRLAVDGRLEGIWD